MDQEQPGTTVVPAKRLWKRIADYPLVAMLLAIALYAAGLTAGSLLARLLPPMGREAKTVATVALVLVCLLVTYKLAIVRLGARPRDELRGPGAVRQLGIGLVIGTLLFSLIVGVAAVADVYNIVGEGGTGNLVVALVTTAIMPGLTEEMLFRGILFRWLEEFGGSWFALALTSALFGLGHIFNAHATPLSSFAIAIEAGVLLGGAYMLTRSLWMPIGLHAAWNFTQGEIFDVPVSGFDSQGLVTAKLSGPDILSGGAFGLEASVIAMTIATAAGVWLVVRAVRKGEVVRPYWVRTRMERTIGSPLTDALLPGDRDTIARG